VALAIRLRQQGRRNHNVYRVVIMDARTRRDGKYLEAVGWYNPFETAEERICDLKADRIQHWLDLGAQMTESVQQLVRKNAPSVMQWHVEKQLTARKKACAKRKARRGAAA
jgi:small subunit ribosomal protein S16